MAVLQGDRDAFGGPGDVRAAVEHAPGRQVGARQPPVVVVAVAGGDHQLRTTLALGPVLDLVQGWTRLVASAPPPSGAGPSRCVTAGTPGTPMP